MLLVNEWMLLERINKGKIRRKVLRRPELTQFLSLKHSKKFQGEAL